MSRRAHIVAATAAVVWMTACELQVDAPSLPKAGSQTVVNGRDAAAIDASVAIPDIDAAVDAGAVTPYQGNPLCNASRATGCYPDDPITPMTAAACSADAGSGDSGAALACHVEPMAGTVGAVCLAAGSGYDDDPCSGPTDCASGFECVVRTGTASRCRPYCCSGQSRCAADDDGGGAGEFCDIQATDPGPGGTSTKVPVCMPIHKCSLSTQVTAASGAYPCGPDDTCAVVRDDGATSCVAVGTAMVGDPCDEDHCAAGLVCLGTPGARLCYQLCTTPTSSLAPLMACPPAQTCKGGLPLFPDTNDVGICE